jgi:transposase
MPAHPRWLLALPDAIAQLEELDREWLTRRDLEELFGISKPRAAVLMRTFGAERLGNVRMLARTQLLRHLRARKKSAAYSGEVDRRERLITALRRARISGIRVPVAANVLSLKLAGLPEGVTVARGRIEVQFNGAREAVGRLFALAQALTNDYERFEDRVGRGGGESA